jgi:hypothetical protein
MPKLPDASNLSGVNIGAPRSMVNMPVPDIAGATNAVARGISDLGQGITVVADERRKKASAQERFDTKMGLLKAEEAYADAVKDLDPLAPDYVDRVKRARIETFSPYLSNVKDPENRQYFDLTTGEDFVNIGIKAEGAAKQARVENGKLQVADYYDAVTKKALSGEFTGDVRAEVERLIRDNPDFDELTANELTQKYGSAADAVVVDIAFNSMSKNGYTLRPDVNAAISAAEQSGAPSWMGSYLRRLAGVESAGGYKLTTSKSSAGGIYQFTDGTGKQYGLNSFDDKNDAGKATNAAIRLTLDNYKQLKNVLGRDPTPGELYLAHQQGAGGVEKLLANPDRLAATAVGLKAVENNLPKSLQGRAATMTSAEFMQYWGGKFSGDASGGMMDPNETLSVIETLPEYQRLPVTAQMKIREGIASSVEKQNKEIEAAAKIDLQRDTVDYAVNEFDDPAKGEAYIKATIADPDTREDTLTLFRKEQDQRAENTRRQNEANLNQAWGAATAALEAGDTAEALKIARTAEIPPKDRDALLERIDKGSAVVDDPEVYNEIQALKLGSPEDREKFANLDLIKLQGKLKPGTIEALARDQEALKKQMGDTGKAVSLETPAAMLDQRLREIGIDVSAKAKEADLRTARSIRSIMARNLEAATRARGTDLSPVEIEKVMDQTFMEFRVEDKGILWDSEKTMTLGDVVEEFVTIEEEYSATPGEYLTRAERAIRAKGREVTPQLLRNWLRAAVDNGVIRKAQ